MRLTSTLLACASLAVIVFFQVAPESRAQNVVKRQVESAVSSNREVSSRAIDRLNAETQEGTWRVKWNNNRGVPRMLSGGMTAPYGANPEAAAKAFLNKYADLFIPRTNAAKTNNSNDFKLRTIKSVKGGNRAEFQQTVSGVPVYRCSVVLIMDPEGRVLHVSNSAHPLRGVNTTPQNTIDQIDAIFRAQSNPVDAPVSMKHHDLVIYPGPPARLAYRVIYTIGATAEPWEYVLDERTGETLSATRLVLEAKKRLSTSRSFLERRAAIPSASLNNTGAESIAVCKIQVNLKVAASLPHKPVPDADRPQTTERSECIELAAYQVGPPPGCGELRHDTGKETQPSPPPHEIATTREEGGRYVFSA